MDRFKITVALN